MIFGSKFNLQTVRSQLANLLYLASALQCCILFLTIASAQDCHLDTDMTKRQVQLDL